MASFLVRYPTEDVFLQPQLNRYHHPFRSPMYSETMNLQTSQIRYDIYLIYQNLNTILASLTTEINSIVNGSNDSYVVGWDDLATPSPISTTVKSLAYIAQLIERMSMRLEILEKDIV